MLAYICRKPLARATRAELVAFLWPEIDLKNAKHSLSQLVYALRRRVPDLPIAANAELIALTGLDIDLLALERDVDSGRLLAALSRYEGRFLPNDDVASSRLLDWRDEIEEDVAQIVSTILQEQSHVCALSELRGIILRSELVLSIHPHLAGAQIALVEATARTGQIARAERLYRSISEADPEQGAALPPLSSFFARSAGSPEMHSTPFSGRAAEVQALLECWQRATSGDGQVAVVLGEPGIGKTRLADQFLRRVAIRGGAVWVANCCAATQRLPYSVVHELITEHVDSTTEVWGTFSPGSEDDRTLLPFTKISSDEYRHTITDRLTSFIIGRSRNQPIAILIDDAQWADEYTALLIAYWAYRLRRESVMLVLTVRTHEAEPPPDWIECDLGRPLRMPIGRLSLAAAEEIVCAFERNQQITLDRPVKDAVLWQSGGRPFLLIEALASVVREGVADRLPYAALSEPAESLLLRRFRNLSKQANAVVGLLSVWGRPMSTKTLHTMSGLTEDHYATVLNTLHTRGIAHLHEGVISFPHDLMRETALRSVLPATRILYHKRVAAELTATGGPPGLIAQHYAHSGDSEAAGRQAIYAAEQALSSHSYSDYEFYCRLCIKAGAPKHRVQAAVGLARYLIQIGRSSEIEDLAPVFGGEEGEHRMLSLISLLERDLASGNRSVTDLLTYAKTIISDVDASRDPARASLAATMFSVAFDACAGELDYADVAGASHGIGACTNEAELQMESVLSVWHGVTRDVAGALSMAKTTLDRLPSTASPTTRAGCLYAFGTLLLLSGRVSEARAQFELALPIACDSGDIRRQLSIFINNGVALMESGDMNGARQSFEKAVITPNVHFRIRCYTNLAMLHYEEGDTLLAAQAAESVLSMNSSYQSPSLGCTSHAILGLIAIQKQDRAAADNYANAIGQHGWSSLDDVSYTAAFLSQMLIASGREPEALTLLAETVEHTKRRDVLCAMRIQCEIAKVLGRSQPDVAFRLARTIASEAKAAGANRIHTRARNISEQLAH